MVVALVVVMMIIGIITITIFFVVVVVIIILGARESPVQTPNPQAPAALLSVPSIASLYSLVVSDTCSRPAMQGLHHRLATLEVKLEKVLQVLWGLTG